MNFWNMEAKPGWICLIITLQPTPHSNHQEGKKKATTSLEMLQIYSAAGERKIKEDSIAQTADPSMSNLGANWAPNTSKYFWTSQEDSQQVSPSGELINYNGSIRCLSPLSNGVIISLESPSGENSCSLPRTYICDTTSKRSILM